MSPVRQDNMLACVDQRCSQNLKLICVQQYSLDCNTVVTAFLCVWCRASKYILRDNKRVTLVVYTQESSNRMKYIHIALVTTN